MTKKVLPNELVLEEAGRLLEEGREVSFTPLGDSMLPFIHGGKDTVTLKIVPNVDVGDIVLARLPGPQYALHRVVDRNHSTGRGGYIPSLGEIRNCHINVGTGKELTIRELSELVVKAIGFEGTVEFDASKPDGTMRKLIDVSKLHSLGWTHKVEIEDGVQKLFEWYKESLN